MLRWYKDLISGSENEFNQLNKDLSTLKAFLKDAGNRSNKDAMFKEMEVQIRDLVYDVEDTVDTCLTKAAEAKTKSSIRRRLGTSRVSLATEVKSLRDDKVKPMLEKMQAYLAGLGAAAQGPAAAEEQPPTSKRDQSIRQDKVVGFEDEEEKLTSYLKEETEKLDVISIIGMPGLGKTTLAWKIFQNDDICFQFPTRIWVQVSQRFNSREVFLNILKRFTSNDMSGLSDPELVNSVRSCLEREKFLLVMDDVWSADDWNIIQDALPTNNASSKVMITSREKKVGLRANVRREPHMLRFFRPDESWKLLQLEVYGNEEECPPQLKPIGQQIADQCYGVPLTVVVVGGILVDLFEKTRVTILLKKEWENVKENVSNFVQNDKVRRITDVVELSYNRLPDYLRECFLYMAVFPEEHVIPAWMLMRLWAAEGFIHPKGGKSLEDAAEENLGDLVSRNLLMLDDVNPMGEIKTCRVHDMIRSFCRLKALEQKLFQEIKISNGVFDPPVSEVPTLHRLCFHSDLTKFFSGKPNGPRMRSFLCFYKEPVNLEARYISAIPDAFNLLRVLESISIKFHQFPAKVTKLMHLRYITLHIDALTILPEPLAQLWNLQTLVVETKSHSITMKANIWKMYRLRHLKMKAAIVLDDKWDGEGGENLQSLSRLAPESCTQVSKRACNLKALGVRGKLATLFSKMSMETLHRLEKLKLVNDVPSGSERQLLSLPKPRCFPPKLARLTLSSTFLEWEHMSILAEIDTLEVLKLKENAFIGESWNPCDDVFPSLQFILIINAEFKSWKASANTFPSLRCLVLNNCEKLKHIPDGLDTNLETLEIERLGKSAVESARKIELKKFREQQQKPKLGVRFRLKVGPGCGNIPVGQQ